MRAIKLYSPPADLEASLDFWKRMALDTILVGQGCLDHPEFLAELRKAGLRWSIIEPVFLLDENAPPERYAVDHRGRPASVDWVRFACPTHPEHRAEFLARLESHAALGPDGMSLDFVRFFQFWEKVPPGAAPEGFPRTCFCPRCQEDQRRFLDRNDTPALGPDGLGAWRTALITNLVSQAATAIRRVNPAIRIGLHSVPWSDEDFGGARTTILGQDLAALAGLVDYLTPMAYHHMVGRPPQWISELTAAQNREVRGRIPVVPCLQVRPYYTEAPLGTDEFRRAVEAAHGPESGGLAIFHHDDLAAEPDKAAWVAGGTR